MEFWKVPRDAPPCVPSEGHRHARRCGNAGLRAPRGPSGSRGGPRQRRGRHAAARSVPRPPSSLCISNPSGHSAGQAGAAGSATAARSRATTRPRRTASTSASSGTPPTPWPRPASPRPATNTSRAKPATPHPTPSTRLRVPVGSQAGRLLAGASPRRRPRRLRPPPLPQRHQGPRPLCPLQRAQVRVRPGVIFARLLWGAFARLIVCMVGIWGAQAVHRGGELHLRLWTLRHRPHRPRLRLSATLPLNAPQMIDPALTCASCAQTAGSRSVRWRSGTWRTTSAGISTTSKSTAAAASISPT